jgi:ribosomal protein S14
MVPLALSPEAARALVEALRSYRDPRDCGRCDQCGTGRLDDTFTCTRCGQPNGLFGELVRERLARHRAQ